MLEKFPSTTLEDSAELHNAAKRTSSFYRVPNQQQVMEVWQDRLERSTVYCKSAKMHAKIALHDGVLESTDKGLIVKYTYHAGDFILCSSESGRRYVMENLDFSSRYDRTRPEAAMRPSLAAEGFKLYRQSGKVWACSVAEEAIREQFPTAEFITSWGASTAVQADDFLVMPHPAAGEVYRIDKIAFGNTYTEYTQDNYVPSQAEALAHWEGALRSDGYVYCKTSKMHALLATEDGVLTTVVDGVAETNKKYRQGDFIMHGTEGARYTMEQVDFVSRYERARPEPASDPKLADEGFLLYRPTGKVWARELTGQDIVTHFPAGSFVASWGSPMIVEAGDFLAMPFPAGGELYRIEKSAFKNTYTKDDYVPSQAETLAHWGSVLQNDKYVYAKTTKMHAKRAAEDGVLETILDGVVETSKPYKKGDFIMHGTEGERYAMKVMDFSSRYETEKPEPAATSELMSEGFNLYMAKGKVWAREMTSSDIEMEFPAGQFIASWGSPMIVQSGDFLAMPFPAGGEVYRIEKTAFANTYSKLALEGFVPSQNQVLARWQGELRVKGNVFYKTAKMHAKVAQEDGVLETIIDGVVETTKPYNKDDYIMCGTEGERYTMTEIEFEMRYLTMSAEPASDPKLAEEGFMLYPSTGKVWAHSILAEEIVTEFPAGKFMASWGSEMEVCEGDFLAMPYPAGAEVYRIEKTAFSNTYAPVEHRRRKGFVLFASAATAVKRLSVSVTGSAAKTIAADFEKKAEIPTQAESLAKWQGAIKAEGKVYSKTAKVHAKFATEDGTFENLGAQSPRTPSMSYRKGDFIMQGDDGERYSMSALDFTSRYERGRPEPSKDPSLAVEGFQLFHATGKIWAHELSAEDIAEHFVAGQIMTAWDSPLRVQEGDFLAVPFPTGGEIYRVLKRPFGNTYEAHEQAKYVPLQAEALSHWEELMREEGSVYSKTKKLHALIAKEGGVLETIVDGVVETRKSYEKGDFIIHGTKNERYTMSALEFGERYERARPEPASDPALGEEGFKLYRPIGKILAREVSGVEVSTHFPAGQFIASWGSPMEVLPGDFLAMPFPAGGELYRIEKGAFANTYAKDGFVPSQAETLAQWQGALRHDGGVYCKTARMHAKLATADGVLETVINGVVETSKKYNRDDFIMHGTEGERYTMSAVDFTGRYEHSSPEPATDPKLAEEGFQLYRSTGKVWARQLSADEVSMRFPMGEFIASWGSPMKIAAGDFLAMPFPSGGEVYRIEETAFNATYSEQSIEDSIPSQADALRHWEGALRSEGNVYCKNTKMLAMRSVDDGVLETVVNGVVETRKPYRKGDFILQGTEGERYGMNADDFQVRYEAMLEPPEDEALVAEGFRMYRSTGKIWAHELTARDMSTHFPAGQFFASWGSPMEVKAGDQLAVPYPAGGELYRIEEVAFANTYVMEEPPDFDSEDEEDYDEEDKADATGFTPRKPNAPVPKSRPRETKLAAVGMDRRASTKKGMTLMAAVALIIGDARKIRRSRSRSLTNISGALATTSSAEDRSISDRATRRLLAITVRLHERRILEATRAEVERHIKGLDKEEGK
jgi:hypothetical protein